MGQGGYVEGSFPSALGVGEGEAPTSLGQAELPNSAM